MGNAAESYKDAEGYNRYDCKLVDAGSEPKKMKFVEQGLMGNSNEERFQSNEK